MVSSNKASISAKKERNSSIELYRIIATFTVLIVHFNGWFVGGMRGFDFHHPTLFGAGQMIIEALTCICVNMFLIISGYFGIRLKLTSVLRLCLLLVFIYVPFYIVEVLVGGAFSIKSLLGCFFVISRSGYFIQGYLMLMFFSPVLNAFIEKHGRQILPWTLCFVVIEFWFETVRGIENFGFNKGYSIIYFVLMYMIARCIALNKEKLLTLPMKCYVLGYLFCTIIICFMYVGGLECSFAYSNPIVIVSSICSFVPFMYRDWHNRLVNWVAGGTLAVYIIQVREPAYSLLVKIDNYFLNNYSYSHYLLLCGLVILLTFVFCVAYQKACEKIVNPVIEKLPNSIKAIELR